MIQATLSWVINSSPRSMRNSYNVTDFETVKLEMNQKHFQCCFWFQTEHIEIAHAPEQARHLLRPLNITRVEMESRHLIYWMANQPVITVWFKSLKAMQEAMAARSDTGFIVPSSETFHGSTVYMYSFGTQ